MKLLNYLFVFVFILPLFIDCEDDEMDDEPERTTVLVTLQNNAGGFGAGGCFPTEDSVTFIVSYRDISVDADITGGGQGFINVLVEDNESINVIVQRTSDDVVLGNANVNVRTESRPGPEDAARRIIYCEPFEIQFENF
ncbi:hypothetical protein [Winogradskyella sp. 3972H.M.0a.05]|uniref:hypothetical protein n=1 Tax=Winogradskyella sp. 3972H.M.0a.05 TaxID=2950277 RepID=UPI0033946E36